MSHDFDRWQPITADDATIKAALAEANIPTLLAALVHITGDDRFVTGDIKPEGGFFVDQQGNISEADQAKVRAEAFEILKQYRDGGCQLPPTPNHDVIRKIMDFLVAEELPDDYLEFLESELSLTGADPYGQPALEAVPEDKRKDFHVVVIGSGMSGILASIRLKEAGIPYTVIEKNANVGGTWLENTYPGCRVDSPNHTYSYSFAPKDWPNYFSPQGVLLEYFDHIANEYDLRENIRFNTEVEKSVFDESTNTWKVHVKTTHGQEVIEANAVISAVGQLNRPRYPDIKGLGTFDGPAFHSARWEHEHDLQGKRVAVIGTGASAFQFVPEIAGAAKDIVIFQRTPPWISPREEYHDAIPEGKHWLLNHVPFYAKWYRFLMFWRTSEGLLGMVKRDKSWNQPDSVGEENDMLRQMLTEAIKMQVGDDPDLLEKTVPKYPPAGKRMLVDNGTWIKTLKRDNVHVTTDPIAEINENGIKTESGTQYDFDVIIYGTGFHANKFLWPMEFYGKGGQSLQERWKGDPKAYLGVSVPGFPNLFMMYGPNTNIVVNGSIIFFSECEMRYILGCIALLLDNGKKALDCKTEVHDAYNVDIDEGNELMAWGSPHVNSWYKNEQGRVTQNWPFTLREFWAKTRKANKADYNFL